MSAKNHSGLLSPAVGVSLMYPAISSSRRIYSSPLGLVGAGSLPSHTLASPHSGHGGDSALSVGKSGSDLLLLAGGKSAHVEIEFAE